MVEELVIPNKYCLDSNVTVVVYRDGSGRCKRQHTQTTEFLWKLDEQRGLLLWSEVQVPHDWNRWGRTNDESRELFEFVGIWFVEDIVFGE